MIHRKADVAAFLSRQETGVLDWAGLAVFLTCEVLVGAVPTVEPAPTQDLALWTHQVIAVIHKPATGDHVGFLNGMDGNVGRNVPFFE